MFEETKPTYRSVLHERVWAKTKEILGFNLRTALLAAGSLAVGGSLHAWLQTGQAAVERISVGLVYTAGFVMIGLMTYVLHFVRSASAIHEEQQDEIKRHEDALNAYGKKRDLGDRLVGLRREGVALRNRRLRKQQTAPLDGLELAGWNLEVDAWEKRVLDAIRGQVSAKDYGRFETLDTYTPSVRLADQQRTRPAPLNAVTQD